MGPESLQRPPPRPNGAPQSLNTDSTTAAAGAVAVGAALLVVTPDWPVLPVVASGGVVSASTGTVAVV